MTNLFFGRLLPKWRVISKTSVFLLLQVSVQLYYVDSMGSLVKCSNVVDCWKANRT